MGAYYVADVCHLSVDSARFLPPKAAFATVSEAGHAKLAATKASKGWAFPMASAGGSSFGRDFGVTFTDEQVESKAPVYYFNRPLFVKAMPGFSVFRRDDSGAVFHTYSGHARGMEEGNGVFEPLDTLPDGRNESSAMHWVKHKEEYGAAEGEGAGAGDGGGAGAGAHAK